MAFFAYCRYVSKKFNGSDTVKIDYWLHLTGMWFDFFSVHNYGGEVLYADKYFLF